MVGHDHALIGNEEPGSRPPGTLMPFGFGPYRPFDVFVVMFDFNPPRVSFGKNLTFAMLLLSRLPTRFNAFPLAPA